jgi:hypothetical protein
MGAMSRSGDVIEPDAALRSYHDRKYRVFRKLHDDQMSYRVLMNA